MKERTNGFCVSGFVCSFFNPLLGFIFSIVGISQAAKYQDKGKGLGIAGLIISIINMIVMVIAMICIFVAIVAIASNPGDLVNALPNSITQEVKTDIIESAARDYYEDTVFGKLSSKDLKKYTKSGYVVDLDTLIKKNVIGGTSKDVVKSCDTKKTKITVYPKSPYTKTDYKIEKSIKC